MNTKSFERYITPKTRAGGMSAKRYQRLREEQLNKFYKEAADFITNEILPIIDNVDIIIFGGNVIRAQEFLKRGLLNKEIVDKIADKMISTSSIDDSGVQEAKKQLPEILKSSQFAREKEAWEEWLLHLSKEDGKALYGYQEIEESIKMYRVYKLLCLDTYELKYVPNEYKFELYTFDDGSPYASQIKAFGGCVALLKY
jgi:peptide chain release factor subunit 1